MNITPLGKVQSIVAVEIRAINKQSKETCQICNNPLAKLKKGDQVVILPCKDTFHVGCLTTIIQNKAIKCPNCSMFHGAQPIKQPAGTFSRIVIRECCKGYEKFNTIKIEYNIPHGIQNGVHYHGTNRIAYLPDNEQGNKVARMLEKAFDDGLIFTIGRSLKTGQDRIAIFNGITHKTKIGGGGMYGYPDANYLDLVESELAQRGVK